MKKHVLLRVALLALLAALAACSTPMSPAPIVDRNGVPQPSAQQPTQAAPAAPAGHTGDERGYYQVKKGDTLTHIALDNGQSPRDIAAWNNVANPNDIKVGQVLRVLPPEDAANATGGAQFAPVPQQGDIVRTPLAPQGAQSLNKTGPRGDKKPYSDAAFADMQKPDAASAPAPAASGGAYFLQAGAYKQSADAESARARILLLGLKAVVQRAEVNGAQWYRVRVGPYAKLDDMNRARVKLADNKIQSTIVRQ